MVKVRLSVTVWGVGFRFSRLWCVGFHSGGCREHLARIYGHVTCPSTGERCNLSSKFFHAAFECSMEWSVGCWVLGVEC